MAISLMSLIENNADLNPVAGEIHFPDSGPETLSKIEQNHFWYTARRHAVLKIIKNAGLASDDGKKVLGLDIGCGTGFNAVYFTEIGFPTAGIDANDSFLTYKKAGRGAGFIRGDIFSIEPEPEFDFVLLLDVLEHIENDRAFLAQALKFVKPGGIAVITVPAFPALWSATDEMGGHLRRYTKTSLRECVARLDVPAKVEFESYFYGATILPYLLARRSRGNKFDADKYNKSIFPSPVVNSAVKLMLAAEALVLPIGGVPFGSSLFARIRKSDQRRNNVTS